jgi:uncharacterized protein (TIGR03118 family)
MMLSWVRRWTKPHSPAPKPIASGGRTRRPQLEVLEDRTLPSTVFLKTNLVSDTPGLAQITDPNLVNPWGLALNPTPGFFWVADNGAGVATVYDGNGQPVPTGAPLVVTIPPPNGSPPGTTAAPTGIVFNSGSGFVVSQNGVSGPALFLFATEDGTISGWNPTVDPTHAILAVDNSTTSVYKGLALGTNTTGTFLFASNFRTGKIDVFDQHFAPATLSGTFTDPNIPAGFAPFNITTLGGQLFVTYAKQDAAKHDDVAGVGNGFVDVYDTNGVLLQRLAAGGLLNSPWGETLAPASFGPFGNDLLVGNFGDGHINAFNPTSGAFLGQLHDNTGNTLTIDGLWALTFGNGAGAADANTLYFAAGIDHEEHGLFGKVQAVSVTPIVAVGADAGGPPEVKVFDATTGALKLDFNAYVANFPGGVRVAVGDVTGDGVPDIVTAPGPLGGPDIHVYDGKSGRLLRAFLAYDSPFFNGVFVAVGDINGDGFADIITGADAGGGPHVKVFSGKDGSLLRSFMAYDLTFVGGVRVAAGDTTGDGLADIITGAGHGGGPHVKVFSGLDNSLRQSFMAYSTSFVGGVYVGTGDVNGDGRADVITGAGAGGGPHVEVFSGSDGSLLRSFLAYDPTVVVGVRVGAIADINGDGRAEVVTGAGPGGGPHVKIFDDGTGLVLGSFFALDAAFTGGIFVGGV